MRRRADSATAAQKAESLPSEEDRVFWAEGDVVDRRWPRRTGGRAKVRRRALAARDAAEGETEIHGMGNETPKSAACRDSLRFRTWRRLWRTADSNVQRCLMKLTGILI